MRPLISIVSSIGLLGAAFAMAGCTTSAGCPSWAAYATPADAEADADAVVIGQVGDQVGTRAAYGVFHDVRVYEVTVEAWLKGSGPDTIDVASAPSGCTDSPYPAGDDFAEAGGTSVLFLRNGGGWQGLLPGQQLLPASEDGVLPAAWPSP